MVSVFHVSAARDDSGLLSRLYHNYHYLYDPARVNYVEVSHIGVCVGGHCFHAGAVLIWMMVILELLHIFWFYLIVKMIFRTIVDKEVKQDIRSDEEDTAEWYDDDKKKQ